jgi:uroporphyrinogen III methyltransferase/synthase
MRQPDINALLVERAKRGLRVVRLKGGDPFVFGRGGEEAEVCREAGVPFEIVPGVTSAIAAPAYAGIPVTHRDAASSFAIITGHERDDARESGTRAAGAAEQRRDWAKLAHAADTLLFLMGVEALPEITARLQEQGRSSETPVALVQWGTWSHQRVVSGTLSNIVERVREAGLKPPAVCIVGEVVRLRETLRWFDNPHQRPLFGKRIVVTRAREQASALSDRLREEGAEPIEFPVIRIVPAADLTALESAISSLLGYDWVIFTSANSVPIFAERLASVGRDSRAFAQTRIAAIGPATAEALRKHLNLVADFVPKEAVAEAILEQFPEKELRGKRILIPRAADAREILPEQLRERGAVVDVVPIYETLRDAEAVEELRAQLESGEIDAITFTSSSTVKNFVTALGEGATGTPEEWVAGVTIAAIGPITAETARELGLNPTLVSAEHTIPGLVSTLVAGFAKEEVAGG